MSVEIRDQRFTSVVGAEVRFEKIATGFRFTEGPLWHPKEHLLLFSDIAGDQLQRWSERDGVTTFRKPSNMANGLAYDRAGNVLACEHASSQVTCRASTGDITPIATHYQGRQLNSPNDIVCAPDGGIYFTDPPYGRVKFFGVPREQELPFQGVYRVGADPKCPTLLVDDFDRPNGLCFSLDRRRLFINDTARQHIRVFDLNPNGSLRAGKVWAETKGEGAGAPDGMKIDSMGNLYCCGPGGINVFTPDAVCLGVIRVPEYTANFAWGDADFRSLFITASKSVYRIRTKIPGLPVLVD
ncbi:MAG: SMP-30/gluconolactonase/LRE family protein [Verrucomicrobia bacterium]|nr:SMP-30/gluconolactonase/LRE family protein [Verrucomicrobiota bacterium]